MSKDFDQPNIAVDTVPIFFDKTTQTINVVLAKRQYEPYIGEYALPGVLLNMGEFIDQAVYRALESKAGISKDEIRLLLTLNVFDAPMRDPRSSTLSIAKIVVLNQGFDLGDVEALETVPLNTTKELPFDHQKIIAEVTDRLRGVASEDSSVLYSFLGDQFTTRDMTSLLSELDTSVSTSNLAKRLKNKTWLESVETKSLSRSSGRPSTTWKFKK